MRGSGQSGRASSRLAVTGFVLFIVSLVLSPVPQAYADTETDQGYRQQVLAPHTAAWFLEMMRRLLHEGRAGESYQLAQLAVAYHPHSPNVLLGAAFAAAAGGRCELADRHLAMLQSEPVMANLHQHHMRKRDMLKAQCHGPWRRRLAIQATMGYRPSLTDRARQFEMQAEPGSRLHGLCVRLAGLCDPNRPFTGDAARDSGIDLWMQFRFENNYRAGTAWDVDFVPLIFRRHPSRKGHEGQGAILYGEVRRHLPGGRQLSVSGDTGTSSFRQGDPALAFSQSHNRLRVALSVPHNQRLMSRFGHGRTWVRSRWLDLHRRRHDYRLFVQHDARHALWFGIAGEQASQSGPGRLVGSRSKIFSVGGQRRMARMTASLWQERQRQKFNETLYYLAFPHQTTTRTTNLDLVPKLPEKLNFKVVVSFSYRKISSPDVFNRKNTKALMFTLRYTIGDKM